MGCFVRMAILTAALFSLLVVISSTAKAIEACPIPDQKLLLLKASLVDGPNGAQDAALETLSTFAYLGHRACAAALLSPILNLALTGPPSGDHPIIQKAQALLVDMGLFLNRLSGTNTPLSDEEVFTVGMLSALDGPDTKFGAVWMLASWWLSNHLASVKDTAGFDVIATALKVSFRQHKAMRKQGSAHVVRDFVPEVMGLVSIARLDPTQQGLVHEELRLYMIEHSAICSGQQCSRYISAALGADGALMTLQAAGELRGRDGRQGISQDYIMNVVQTWPDPKSLAAGELSTIQDALVNTTNIELRNRGSAFQLDLVRIVNLAGPEQAKRLVPALQFRASISENDLRDGSQRRAREALAIIQ